MSDTLVVPGTTSTTSAGQQLRAAREACGLHIVALAAALKVPVRKLEALEANRWEELTDATFVRALASSVARHLKVDVVPILQALPAGKTAPIEVPDNLGHAGGGAHLPFSVPAGIPKVAWLVLALLLGALALYMLPDAAFKSWTGLGNTATLADVPVPSKSVSPVTTDAGVATSEPQSDGTAQGKAVIEQPDTTTHSVAIPIHSGVVANGLAAGAVATSGKAVLIKAVADTWIEVTGQDGNLRAQRLLKQGETAEFADAPGYSIVLGNAAGARVSVQGSAFDLAPFVKNNIARFDVK